jgi:glycosyltransferase involved in cell wall biosynthesis
MTGATSDEGGHSPGMVAGPDGDFSVSVVIPTHNRAALLPRAIRSALRQTVPPAEIIVVDDGSSDETVDVVAGYGAPVRLLSQKHSGACAARNLGIQQAKGRWIAFLDSDDEWLPRKLERQAMALRSAGPSVACIFTAIFRIQTDSGHVRMVPLSDMHPWEGSLCVSNVVGSTSTVLARRDALLAVGGFDESLPASQDWDLWLRLAIKYELLGLPEPLVNYFDHSDQISGKIDAVCSGRLQFYLKHEARIRHHLDDHQLRKWQTGLARLSILNGGYDRAKTLQREVYRRHRIFSDGALLMLMLLCPRLLRFVALQRRRFAPGRAG